MGSTPYRKNEKIIGKENLQRYKYIKFYKNPSSRINKLLIDTINITVKILHHVYFNNFSGINNHRSTLMVGKYVHSNGPKNQTDNQHSCGYSNNNLVTKLVWGFPVFRERTYLNKKKESKSTPFFLT